VAFRLSFALSLGLLLSLRYCNGLPTVLIQSGKSKCFSVEAPVDTIIRVIYSAPDIILDKKDEDYARTHLTINVRPANRVTDTKLHSAPILDRLHPKSLVLTKREGTLEHRFEVDGQADVCIRNQGAGSENPMRFGLRIVKTDHDVITPIAGTGSDLDGHLSHMEMEMKRIESGMKRVLSEADFSKERDALFHKQTLSMHSATLFWPIVQVFVLLATGFAQASHIVRFFQSRRII